MMPLPPGDAGPRSLALLSVIIPAQNEQESIGKTLEHLYAVLQSGGVPHEIIAVDDGSTDATWAELEKQAEKISTLRPVRNESDRGFGRAVVKGFDVSRGDAVVIMMADESDDCADVVRYWSLLNEGWECVFGSRFGRGGNAVDYPGFKLALNRVVNAMIRLLFRIRLNDTTNAFKAYRRTTLEGCRPFLSPHFNLTVELPLKAIVRGYSWTVIPTTWRNRESGASKLKLKEMGSRYLFIVAYVWLEKYFSRGDYKRADSHVAKGIGRL
jgi:dolichol-phosphate mannosyltransferase